MMRVLLEHRSWLIMQRKYKHNPRFYAYMLAIGSLLFIPFKANSSSNPYDETGFDLKHAKFVNIKTKDVQSIELEADQVKFSQDKSKATASGNVVVTAEATKL